MKVADPEVPSSVADVLDATGLVYSTDRDPGYRRQGPAPSFRYVGASGRALRDASLLARIARLALPPAWTDVWICQDARGHLQATGRDARGRKQYRYHAKWRTERDSNKFDRLPAFASALPAIRAAVERDLALPGLPRDKVLAAMVALLDRTCVRVGGERYRRENGSFGLTTLRNRHVDVEGERVRIRFRGKSGKEQDVALSDRRIASIVRRCRDLPGYELFRYVEGESVRSVRAEDVNAYVKAAAGEEYSAKDFRTWGATVVAANALLSAGAAGSKRESTRSINAAIGKAAELLGNTLAVCRKSYVHPGVLNPALAADVAGRRRARRDRLSADECRALALLAAAAKPLTTQLSRSLRATRARATRDSPRRTHVGGP
jgi:DNA topoisomerase-1